MVTTLIARNEPSLSARIVSRRALYYADAPGDGLPAHVRAASGLCWFEGKLAMVQDDALILALLDYPSGRVEALPLPVRADGARLFDKQRGNKADKLDFEGCLVVQLAAGPTLLGIASGSRKNRETLLMVRATEGRYDPELFDASALYARLHQSDGWLSSELNLEGAVWIDGPEGGVVRLFQRSNGNPLGSGPVTCASCDLPFAALAAYLEKTSAEPPVPFNVQRYALGEVAGARLTFTDATPLRTGQILFAASAEASPNAYDDGVVTGSALGVIDGPDVRTCPLLDEQGQLVAGKAEGIALLPGHAGRALVVFDPDDHRAPATLAELVLEGF